MNAVRIVSTIALATFVAAGVLDALAQGNAVPTASASPSALAPGTTIDSSNAARYSQYLPAAAQAAVQHGLRIQIVPTKRLDWSAG
ncbi:MAG TPA: hypothetical protein VMH37_04875, partial [Candidatus Binataceae bacterium]|nr:hypothetical protein [Candidatus Binataceae bacterium]